MILRAGYNLGDNKLPIAANDNINPKIDPLLRLADVMLVTSLGSSTIYRKIGAGNFPHPLRLGPGSVRWRTSEIVGWVDGLKQTCTRAA